MEVDELSCSSKVKSRIRMKLCTTLILYSVVVYWLLRRKDERKMNRFLSIINILQKKSKP